MLILSLQSGAVGPSVEIKRERGVGNVSGIVQSLMLMVVGVEQGVGMGFQGVVDLKEEGEPIIVSVGLLPPPPLSATNCSQADLPCYGRSRRSY